MGAQGMAPRHWSSMSYYDEEDGIRTLALGLDSKNADELKKLAALTGQKVSGKKADIVAIIVRHLSGERLRAVWEGLDELERAAVAETVHSLSSQFEDGRFRAKYGQDPNWGTGEHSYAYKPSAPCLFFCRNRVMADDLKARLLEFVPEPREVAIAAFDGLPPVYARPYMRWNEKERIREAGTEDLLAVGDKRPARNKNMNSQAAEA
jgi:hypothetical protein